jgi:hypothetical protein
MSKTQKTKTKVAAAPVVKKPSLTKRAAPLIIENRNITPDELARRLECSLSAAGYILSGWKTVCEALIEKGWLKMPETDSAAPAPIKAPIAPKAAKAPGLPGQKLVKKVAEKKSEPAPGPEKVAA